METGKKFKTFENRIEAAELLAPLLKDLKGEKPLVLAIPRGAVPMGKIISDSIGGQLDLTLVRKIRHPYQPEFAIGAVTEFGDILMDRSDGLTAEEMEEAAMIEVQHLQNRRHEYTGHRHPVSPQGRVVVVVDDGIATGSTMTAAVRSLKAHGARRILVAAPVASQSAVHRLEAEGAEVRIFYIPEYFGAVSYFYNDFTQVSDSEVGEYFRVHSQDIEIPGEHQKFRAVLGLPVTPRGVVLFAHASAQARLSPRNQYIAEFLNRQGIATVLVDLLTPEESMDRAYIFDIHLLADRLMHLTQWMDEQPELRHLPLGIIGASTGAGAALRAAALVGARISALVSRGGRVDLAQEFLSKVFCPTLLLVAGEDQLVIDLNQQGLKRIQAEKKMEIIPGATHLFEEPGALEQVAELTASWFLKHFALAQMTQLNLEPPIYP